MAKRKSFLLRLEPKTFDALQRWAADELRSVNGQIEYLLVQALRRAGRWPEKRPQSGSASGIAGDEASDEAGDDTGDAPGHGASGETDSGSE